MRQLFFVWKSDLDHISKTKSPLRGCLINQPLNFQIAKYLTLKIADNRYYDCM